MVCCPSFVQSDDYSNFRWGFAALCECPSDSRPPVPCKSICSIVSYSSQKLSTVRCVEEFQTTSTVARSPRQPSSTRKRLPNTTHGAAGRHQAVVMSPSSLSGCPGSIHALSGCCIIQHQRATTGTPQHPTAAALVRKRRCAQPHREHDASPARLIPSSLCTCRRSGPRTSSYRRRRPPSPCCQRWVGVGWLNAEVDTTRRGACVEQHRVVLYPVPEHRGA